ncbi:MAG: hypothetical protein ACE5J7_03840 [Candidatus Aenigmatarchaeota archaeon]
MVELTQEVIDHLFDLYKKATGSREERTPRVANVQQALEERGRYEYRAGSQWSGNSKFVIEAAGVRFEPNYSPRGKKEKQEIEKAKKAVEKETEEYIKSLK